MLKKFNFSNEKVNFLSVKVGAPAGGRKLSAETFDKFVRIFSYVTGNNINIVRNMDSHIFIDRQFNYI